MDIEQYIQNLRRLTEESVNTARERAILLSANNLLATIKNRIQKKGTDSNGSEMPGYSTEPAYYSREKFVKKGAFAKKGKSARGDFKNGNTRKTMYLQHGYKEFREVQGRQTSVRDLNLSGDLMKSYVLGQEDGVVLLGFDSQKQSLKRIGNEERVGAKIFSAQQGEIKVYANEVAEQHKELIKNIFRS